MNLLSNSLKFTPSGGQVIIRSKLIRNMDDFDPKDFEGNHQVHVNNIKKLIEKAKFGLIQISVEDSGIGIKDEN